MNKSPLMKFSPKLPNNALYVIYWYPMDQKETTQDNWATLEKML